MVFRKHAAKFASTQQAARDEAQRTENRRFVCQRRVAAAKQRWEVTRETQCGGALKRFQSAND